MQRPSCSLCARIDVACTYPTTRKVNRSRRKTQAEQDDVAGQEEVNSKSNPNPAVPDATPRPYSGPVHHGVDTDLQNIWASPSFQGPSAPFQYRSDTLGGADPQLPDVQHSLRGPDSHLGMDLTPHEPGEMTTEPLLGAHFPSHHQQQRTPLSLDGFSLAAQHPRSVLNSYHVDSAIPELDNFSATNSVLPGSSLAEAEDSRQLLSMDNMTEVDFSSSLAEHLFELFFSRVQNFLPLFHRSGLFDEIFDVWSHPDTQLRTGTNSTALLLNSMFALSARFSTWDHFWSLGPKDRGAKFFSRAQALLTQGVDDQDEPTLRMLQTRILLAYYELASGPSSQAWQATGICCRMAYSLSLHQIDRKSPVEDGPAAVEGSSWVLDEEKRRAWWAVYQMDNFASIAACRPFNIDGSRMEVLLPMSDAAWLGDRPPSSGLLSPNGPSEIWKSLQGCENQAAYAWYLVCNALLRVSQEMFDKVDCAIADLKTLQLALHCFGLGLPHNFRLAGSNMIFDGQNYVEKNWVLCTIILLQAAHTYVALALELQDSANVPNSQQHRTTPSASSPSIPSERFFDICGPFINEQSRAIRMWSPDFIPFASPLITCALVGPASNHVVKSPSDGAVADSETLRNLEAAMSGFVLRRFSVYWPIGTSMEKLLEKLISRTVLEGAAAQKSPMTWLQGVLLSRLGGGT